MAYDMAYTVSINQKRPATMPGDGPQADERTIDMSKTTDERVAEKDAPRKPWCLCMPGVGPHDDGCPAARVTPPAEPTCCAICGREGDDETGWTITPDGSLGIVCPTCFILPAVSVEREAGR